MKYSRNTIYALIFGLALFVASHVNAATEFVSIVDPDDAFGTDYTTLSAWEAATQADLSSTTATLVFSYNTGTASGTIPDGTTVIGQTSGAVASSTHMTGTSASAQILLTNVTGTFQQNEAVYIQGQSASSTYVYLADAGDSVIAVAQCRSTGGSADTTEFTIEGWITSVANYIKIWTDPDDVYGRHNGKWSDSKYRLETGNIINMNEYNVYIDGLQFYTSNTTSGDRMFVDIEPGGAGTTNSYISNNIFRFEDSGANNRTGININSVGSSGSSVYIYNNIFYGAGNGSIGMRAIRHSYNSDATVYAYNNTIDNFYYGIYVGGYPIVAKNNVVQNSTVGYYNSGSWTTGTGNNISSDWTAPGSNSLTTTTVSFVNTAGNDFHLALDDTVAKSNGTSTVASTISDLWYDIDGTARGGAWDIGADEVPVDFTSIICENTSAGGNCADLDYSTLSSWEGAVEADLTATSTRVFSGPGNDGLSDRDNVRICDGTTDMGVSGVVVTESNDQILIEDITGTTSPYVAQSGYVWSLENCDGIKNFWTITGTGDDLGASVRAVAEIDGVWGSEDENALEIDDWTTDNDNRIKIYTTSLARHKGTKESGYRLLPSATSNGIMNYEENLEINGLAIGGTNWNDGGNKNAFRNYATGFNNVIIANNLLYDIYNAGASNANGYRSQVSGTGYVKIYNNIIYNNNVAESDSYGIGPGYSVNGKKYYIYNNTVVGIYYGIAASPSSALRYADVVNNIVQGGSTDYLASSNFDISIGNISSDSSSPNDSFDDITVNFVSTSTGDYHLLYNDSNAKDKGVDLSSTSTLFFLTDIDGGTRNVDGLGWDIGADEVATKIYRSVGNDSSDLSNSATVTISGTTATFSAAQPDNVGVGDVVQFGGSGFYDLAFITARASSTEYSVQAWDGGAPSATTTASMNIYRAHTNLDNWEDQTAGDVNTSIDVNVETRVLVNQNLVASNTIIMVPCYSASTIESGPVIIVGWTTANQNYIKIYTSVDSDEVGISQRHNGKWGNGYMRTALINVYGPDIRIDGISLKTTSGASIFFQNYSASANIEISNNFVWAVTNTYPAYALDLYSTQGSQIDVYNNIFINDLDSLGLYLNDETSSYNVYNNTIISSGARAVRGRYANSVMKNNIVIANGTSDEALYGLFSSVDNTITNDASGDDFGGSGNLVNQNVSFVDEANKDFHLSPTDTSAIDTGTSTVITSVSAVIYDIDNNYRRQWDIGADEASINFDSTVMEDGGEFSSLSAWETANQVDLIATTTAVFSISASVGWIPVGSSLTGSSSGATASTTVVATSSNKILLYNITGTFVSGETVSMDSAVGNYVVLSNGGNPANAVAKIDGAWSGADGIATIDGWTTGINNYVKIYTTDSARHSGKWDNNKYRIFSTTRGVEYSLIRNFNAFTKISGLQLEFAYLGVEDGFANCIQLYESANIDSCIIRRTGSTGTRTGIDFINVPSGGEINIWNNIIYAFYSSIYGEHRWDSIVYTGSIYNNTLYNSNNVGIRIRFNTGNGANFYIKNNLIQNSNSVDYYIENIGDTANNISSDATSPDGASYQDKIVQFADATNNDFHLSTSDTSARNAGTTTTGDINYYYDIDGTARGASWDIGADELPTTYTSIICENTSSGGNCSDMDYSTLASWDTVVDSRLSSSSTRVFGGSITGALNGNDLVYLIDATGTSTASGYIVATTSDQILIDGIVGSTTLPVTASTSYAWRKDASNYWSVSGSDDDFGASAQVTAEIDGIWVSAATNTVIIDGWETDNDNYIKIYTTSLARHDGKWKSNAYRIETVDTRALFNYQDYIWVEGLQLNAGNWSGFRSDTSFGEVNFSDSIVKGNNVDFRAGVYITYNDGVANIWNNIIYGNLGTGGIGITINDSDTIAYIYNNTLYDNAIGIDADGTTIAKNNLVASTTNPFSGTFAAGTDYNATDNSDTPGVGSNNVINANFTFISTTTGSEDFHLNPDDTGAKDQGMNLRSDEHVNVIDDIDGSARANGFDIGADETATKIFRSVGPSNTTALSTGSSTALTIDNLNATFSTAQADNIGVGDAIQYDSDANGTIDSIAFIFSRTDSTNYVVTSASGTAPTAVAGDNDWQIYRAYTSLFNAEAGTENTGINSTVRNFDGWSGGHDLVASNNIWNIACYGDAVDTNNTSVSLGGWTTGSGNYLKIFTPVSSVEVGETQRHSGKWNSDKYVLLLNSSSLNTNVITTGINNVVIDGLQIAVNTNGWSGNGAFLSNGFTDSNSTTLSNNIIKDVEGNSSDAVSFYGVNASYYFYNNIIYGGFYNGILTSVNISHAYIHNNTIVGCDASGIDSYSSETAYNNIVYNTASGDDWARLDLSDDDYNLSDSETPPGSNSILGIPKFVDIANDDYHLMPDSPGVDVGTSTVSSVVTDDVDGHIRRTYDIGADEASVYFDSSVMESGGEFSSLSAWEAANQVDLTANDMAVFAIASSTGWIPVGSNVTGVTSGATASTTVVATSSNKILLYNISGTFVSGEDVQLDGATSNAVELADDGNPAIAVAKIDGAWSSAETSQFVISGWTTGKYNYVKVYTTESARHQGKWDDLKYRLYHDNVSSGLVNISESYVRIDGLQVSSDASGGYQTAVGLNFTNGSTDTPCDVVVENNIIRRHAHNTGGENLTAIYSYYTMYIPENSKIIIRNNLVYDFKGGSWTTGGGIKFYVADGYSNRIFVYNNTFNNCNLGISNDYRNEYGIVAINNIVTNGVNDRDYSFISSSFSDYNISSDTTAPGSNSKTNTTVGFVDATHYDFHLVLSDTAARNAGVDLSSDATSSFASDIDGTARGGVWDIGADEAATEFVSSVMETGGDYSSLSAWEDAVEVNLVASGTLVYSGTLTGTLSQDDSVTLISSGATTTVTGIVVATSSSQILVKNIVDSRGEKYSLTTATGDVWRKDILNYWTVVGTGDALGAPVIAVAEIDGAWSATDTTAVDIDGWTTGPGNYVRVYTTDSARHLGRWSYDRYRLNRFAAGSSYIININEKYVTLDGLQIKSSVGSTGNHGGINIAASEGHYILSNNIVEGHWNSLGHYGVYINVDDVTCKFYNNIIYNHSSTCVYDVYSDNSKIYFYNNTLYNCGVGLEQHDAEIVAKNNIIASTTDSYEGTFVTGTDYNITDSSDSPGTGNNNKSNQTILFVSTSTEDFHLSPADTTANNKGVNLTYDPYLSFTTDIEGDDRGTVWDIGADQNNSINASGESSNPVIGTEVDLTNGLVGHWTFSEGVGATVADRSGNGNDGTWSGSGAHWTGVGWYGNGGIFKDDSDGVTINQSSTLNDIDKLTISAWVFNDGSNIFYDRIVSKEVGGFIVYYSGSGFTFEAPRWDSDGEWSVSYANANNKWIHLLVTYDHSSANNDPVFYINGKKYGVTEVLTPSGSLNSDSSANIAIGNWTSFGTSRAFDGKIDEFRIYNRALNQDEIATLYNKGLANNEWHFRNDYKDRASVCAQGMCKNLSSGGTDNQFRSGYLEQDITSLSLNGSGYATLADDNYFDIASTADFSLIATIKTSDTGSTTIISKRSNSDASSAGYMFGLDYGNGDGIPYFEISDGTNEFSMIASESISDNEWHTVVVVIDEDSQSGNKIYIDGMDKTGTKTGTVTSVYDTANSIALNVGRNGDDTGHFTGQIDRIAFFHHALTRNEAMRESAGGVETEFGTPERTASAGANWDPHGGSAPVAWWKFDEMSGSTVKDYASSSLDGTWTGTGNHFKKGKQNMSGGFNGVDDYVDIGANSALDFTTENFTISSWIYLDNIVGTKYIFNRGDYQSDGYYVYIAGDNLNFRTNQSGVVQTTSASNVLLAKKWYFVSFVRNGADANIFLDGADVTTSQEAHINPSTSSNNALIGLNTSETINGQIDDVKIYDYARTQAQIAWDYNKGAPIAWWGFDEATSGDADGTTLIDFSGNGFSGTGDDGANNTGLSWVTGKVNSAIDFDGVDDYVDVGDINYDINAISFWLKVDSLTEDIVDLDGGTHYIFVNSGEVSATGFAGPNIYIDGTKGTLIDTDWHHVMIVTNTVIDANDFDIGRIASDYFDGKIDQVKIWNYALTTDQVKEEFNGGVVSFGE